MNRNCLSHDEDESLGLIALLGGAASAALIVLLAVLKALGGARP